MACIYRDVASTTSSSGATVTISLPTAVEAGDLLLAVLAFAGGSGITISAPSGWELVLRTNDGATGGLAVYRKRYTPAETASSFDFTLSSAVAHVGAIVAYGGVDQVSPINISGGQANASSTSCTAPSVTTTLSNALLVHVGSAAAGTVTSTPLTGFTERLDTTGGAVSLAVSDKEQATLAASGTKAATLSSAQANIGQLVALSPSQLNTSTQIRDEGNWQYDAWSKRFTTEASFNTMVDTIAQRANAWVRQKVAASFYASNLLGDPWLTLLAQVEMDVAQAMLLEASSQVAETGADGSPSPFLGNSDALARAAQRRWNAADRLVQLARGGDPGATRLPRGAAYFVTGESTAARRDKFDHDEGTTDDDDL